jgi:hypothetical protein
MTNDKKKKKGFHMNSDKDITPLMEEKDKIILREQLAKVEEPL